MIRQQQFEYAYLFGAVCPEKDRAVGLVLPTIGTYCMQQHLNEISKCIEAGIPKQLEKLVFDCVGFASK